MAAMGKGAGGTAPIRVDEDIDNAAQPESDNRLTGQSPQKKRERPAEAAEGRAASEGITLADLQLALAPVLQGLQGVQGRIQTVESQVSQKLDSALTIVQTLDERQKEQGREIQKIVSTLQVQEKNQQAQEREMKDVISRLEALEKQGNSGIWKVSQMQQEDGNRSPALIIGGWPEDQDSEITTARAREYLRKLGVPLDTTNTQRPKTGKGTPSRSGSLYRNLPSRGGSPALEGKSNAL